GGEPGDIAERIDREAPAAACVAGLGNAEKLLDVVPALWIRGEDVVAAAGVEVVAEALEEDVLLVFELGIEAGFVDAGLAFEVLKGGFGEALLPEQADGFGQHFFARKTLGAAHE